MFRPKTGSSAFLRLAMTALTLKKVGKDQMELTCAGGDTDPLSGVKLVYPIILRPNLELQQEIEVWSHQQDLPYTPRQWTSEATEPEANSRSTRMTSSQKLLAALKAVCKLFLPSSPLLSSRALASRKGAPLKLQGGMT